ncbi:phage major capsid protein [Neolewinella aurantiaca]|uniref:Phage major capsid protein n=1 Tax=Neolewinella aurantiaca TaxID=2602767 RepID=A0A5C7FZT0_9BACT|nr:phage major capsid protein [Neolewinella aurantiaca]TXF91216.1 phage major capsid protein [Neolewinella aurantiaca]
MRSEKELLETRARVLREQKTLNDDVKGRQMTGSEERRWNQLQDEIDELTSEIESGRVMKRRMAAKEEFRQSGQQPVGTIPAKAAGIRSIIEQGVTSITEGTIHSAMKRAVTSATAASTIQDPAVTGEVILKPLQNGAPGKLMVDIRDGVAQNTSIAKLTNYAGFNVHAETAEIAAGNLTVAPITWNLVNFASRVDMANNVTRDAVTDWPDVINNAFNADLEHTITKQILSGAGGTEITGIDGYIGVQTVDASDSTLTWDMILQSVQKVLAKNVDPSKIAVIMHPVAWLQLQSLKDTLGQQITKPAGLSGVPIVIHTAVGVEYGEDNDQTRVYVGDFSTCKLGVGGKYEITSEKSKADHDMTQFIMIYRADMQLFHPEHIVRIENVATA